MQKYEQAKKLPEQHLLGAIRGLFYSRSKHNRYLAAVLQRIYQAVIVIYGYAVDHGVPQFFVKLDGRSFKLFKLGEHTADGYGLGFHSVAPYGDHATATGLCSHRSFWKRASNPRALPKT